MTNIILKKYTYWQLIKERIRDDQDHRKFKTSLCGKSCHMASFHTQKASWAIPNSGNPRNDFSLLVEALWTFYQEIYLTNVLLFDTAK